ncbi:RNA polymerase sigma factor [Streptomyces sp. NPDC056402]|uniref:RNA polymerase sigma factor n=1 Tax=Streptomyces sp. NPDC056402 TaxID=3345810 RepID=UPI0035DA5941
MGSEVGGYEDFFREQYPRVRSMLIAICGFTPQCAEDATEEAMIRLLENWGSVSTPNAWVRKVAIREAAKQAKDWNPPLPDFELPDSRAAGVSAAMDLAVTIELAVRDLPPQQRKVMELALREMKPEEIAEVLGCKSEQVRSNLSHARRNMRRLIEEGGE